ncbi:hypothetical protein OROMI_034200 [Orobanche minor]
MDTIGSRFWRLFGSSCYFSGFTYNYINLSKRCFRCPRFKIIMPDKKDFGYSFLCDGPGRGGNCDILTWDAFYLAVYWMLNKYYCMIYFFLALETHHIMARN